MDEIIGIPDQELAPANRCLALKEYDCMKDTCPLWENGMCTIEITGKVLGKAFNQFTMLINAFQSLNKEQKVEALKSLLGKAFIK